MMNKLIGERDYSAMEACHILLKLPLQEDSRVVRSVDCRPSNNHSRLLDLDRGDGDLQGSITPHEKYLARPEVLEELAYVDFLKDWNFSAKNPEKWCNGLEP